MKTIELNKISFPSWDILYKRKGHYHNFIVFLCAVGANDFEPINKTSHGGQLPTI